MTILHAGVEVACHLRSAGRRGRVVDRAHFQGVAGAEGRAVGAAAAAFGGEAVPILAPALLRPSAEYEAVAGGPW